jgi:hypothetical protein
MFFGIKIFDILKIVIKLFQFDSKFYGTSVGVEWPLKHFLRHGYWEGRPINKKIASNQAHRALNSIELLDERDMVFFRDKFQTQNSRLPNLYFENHIFFHELLAISKVFSRNFAVRRSPRSLIINFDAPVYFQGRRKRKSTEASILINIISDDTRFSMAFDNFGLHFPRNTYDLHFNLALSESIINTFRFTLLKAKIDGKFSGDIFLVGNMIQHKDNAFVFSLLQESSSYFEKYGITIRDLSK